MRAQALRRSQKVQASAQLRAMMGRRLPKKVRKVATPSGRAKTTKASIPEAKLSEAIMSKCAAMGISGSGVSYQGLLEKILATEGLANVDQERALEMLKASFAVASAAFGWGSVIALP